MSNRPNGGGFVIGLLIGAAIGAAAAILLSDETTRDAVIGKAREASNQAVDATGDIRDRVGEATAAWQSNAADLYERGRTILEQARATGADHSENAHAEPRADGA
ncbi:MAG: hypothetical protein ACP5O6_04830 [Candidatus Baltobacteraceae bacterium]